MKPRVRRAAMRFAAGSALVVSVFAGGCGGPRVAPADFSLIVVTLDTTRADRLGAYGGKFVPTPNLDRVAREGALFEDAVSQVPLTLPSHSTMFTGRYPAAHGVRHNGIYRLPDAETTLAERLREKGFETAAFVGAFVLNRGFGIEQGFDTFDDVAVDRFKGGQDQVFSAQRTADEVNARVFSWIDRGPKGRFFLWVHYYDPHEPYAPPEKEGRKLEGTGYEREISYVDACFGDLMRKLASAGLLDRSVLVVAGDHGESLGEHGEKTHGVFLYQGAVHVPFLVRAPGLVRAGERVGGPVELADLAPTALDYLGVPPLEKAEGRSLRARIEGREDGRDAVAHAETLLPRLEFGWADLRMVRDARYKYIDAPRPELYDLDGDPKEDSDLSKRDAARVAEMAEALARWERATSAGAGAADAHRALSSEEEERLKSLGYLSGDSFKKEQPAGGPAVDPKDGILEVAEVAKARDLLQAGDAAGALAAAEALLRKNPLNHVARNTKILALADLKRYEEAEKEAYGALAAAEADPNISKPLLQAARGDLASTLRMRGNAKEAEKQYRAILEADGSNDLARIDLARLLIDGGRLDEARAIAEELLKKDPKNGMAVGVRFLVEQKSGDSVAALRSAETLADTRSGDASILVSAGKLLLDSNQALRAVGCFEAALQQGKPDPDLLGLLGLARFRAGGMVPAREAFVALAALRPEDPKPRYFLGNIALKMGEEDRAREHFRVALELDPKFSTPLVTLGRYLWEHGRRDEAVAALDDALRRNPADAHARQLLAQIRGGA